MSIYDLSLLGLSESQLLAIRDDALSKLSSGKVITSVNAPGLTTTFQITASPLEIAKSAVFALQQLNPAVYGQSIINQTINFNR